MCADTTIVRGKTLPDSGVKNDLHELIDLSTVTVANIVNADLSNTAAKAGTNINPNFGAQAVTISSLTAFPTTPEEAPDADYEVANVKYVDDTVEDSVETDGVYDSGWFAIATASTIIKTHNLGTTKVVPMFWLSQSSDGSNAYSSFTWSENSVIFGSMLKNLTTTSITFQGGKDRPAGSLNDSGQDVTYTSGYARIVLIALK